MDIARTQKARGRSIIRAGFGAEEFGLDRGAWYLIFTSSWSSDYLPKVHRVVGRVLENYEIKLSFNARKATPEEVESPEFAKLDPWQGIHIDFE